MSLAAALIAAAWVFRAPLEADPVTHILVQLPLLALAGALLPGARGTGGAWNRGGWAMILTAIFAMAFWMLPRSIDAAVSDPAVAASKFLSLPLLVGLPLRLGWPRAHPLLRGFLKAQALAMLGVLAFLYTHAPVRLCNAYLAEDQVRLGTGFLATALALAVLWVAPLLGAQGAAAPARRHRSVS
ncbi:MAG: hypothetical protein CVT81_05205 [Alphaproteobacteria bacterium HGW-Alphaproteobacteria-3]|nr:MAG: hypothetical protein CVT81_05205 [Alphaproteobacteria bacterium HGW-Alphaproteobacteria-3]